MRPSGGVFSPRGHTARFSEGDLQLGRPQPSPKGHLALAVHSGHLFTIPVKSFMDLDSPLSPWPPWASVPWEGLQGLNDPLQPHSEGVPIRCELHKPS